MRFARPICLLVAALLPAACARPHASSDLTDAEIFDDFRLQAEAVAPCLQQAPQLPAAWTRTELPGGAGTIRLPAGYQSLPDESAPGAAAWRRADSTELSVVVEAAPLGGAAVGPGTVLGRIQGGVGSGHDAPPCSLRVGAARTLVFRWVNFNVTDPDSVFGLAAHVLVRPGRVVNVLVLAPSRASRDTALLAIAALELTPAARSNRDTSMLRGYGSIRISDDNTFPQLAGRTGRMPPRGANDAPACGAAPAIPERWVRHAAPGRTSRLRELSVALPPSYVASRATGYDDGPAPHWGHNMGSWDIPRPDAMQAPWVGGSVSYWIGEEEGYPTYARDDGARQVAATECRFEGPAGTAYSVSYRLETSVGPEYVVAAYWPVGPGAWLQGMGSAHSESDGADLLVALRSTAFVPAP